MTSSNAIGCTEVTNVFGWRLGAIELTTGLGRWLRPRAFVESP